MKTISNTRRLIMRYAQITSSLIWYGALEKEIWRKLRYKKPSLRQLSQLYPTEHDLKLRESGTLCDDFNASKTCWSRIRNGHIFAPEGPFTKRIDDDYPHLMKFRQNPFCSLLGDPFGYSYSFNQLIADVEPKFNGKLLLIDDIPGLTEVQHKPLQWSHTNCRLVDSTEALTLKMTLYKKDKTWLFDYRWPIEIELKELILHLLRIISREPWRVVSDRLIRLFWIFILKDRKNVSTQQLEDVLVSQDTDEIFGNIYQLLYPESCSTPQESPTLDQYLQMNQSLVDNAWNVYFPSFSSRSPFSRCSRETLFLADTFADVWLNQTTPKDKLFQNYPPFHEKLNKCWFLRSRHRIW